MHERHRHRAVRMQVALTVELALDQQWLARRRHAAGDAFAERHDRVARGVVAVHAHGAEARGVVIREQHRAVRRAEQSERVVEDAVQHLIELEHRVHGTAGIEEDAELVESSGERGHEDALVDQRVGQSLEVQLLLDRVRAEADDEEEDAERQLAAVPLAPHRAARHGERHGEDDHHHHDPEVEPAVLDLLERRHVDVLEPDDLRLAPHHGVDTVSAKGSHPPCVGVAAVRLELR
jgi:hypothetical protein